MSHEVVFDDSWEHIAPGHYMNATGCEVIRTSSRTWTLSFPMGLHDEQRHRTARAAKAAAGDAGC